MIPAATTSARQPAGIHAAERDRCARTRHGVAVLLFLLALPAHAAPRPTAAAVASAHPLATAAGVEILGAGGNAFDAAVAVTAALAVVEPASSGLGGGGFWLLHRARDGHAVVIDGRERAPLAASAELYLDETGVPVAEKTLNGALAAAIPGTPAALAHLARHYGRLPLARSLRPAIRLARAGFPVGARYRKLAAFRLAALSGDAPDVFLAQDQVPELGARIRQPQLARTLERLARAGHAGFYAGDTARLLVRGVREAGGVWTEQDLAAYRVVERAPVRGEYRGVTITSTPPPSSGGIVLIEMLNILAGYDLDSRARAERAHLIVEAMRRAYRDRGAYLGDPDFVTIDSARLLSPEYAASQRRDIGMAYAPRQTETAALRATGTDTSHFSIIDREGNRVAATVSINYAFGSGFMPGGTGVLLNNEMDDFVVKPGGANVYGLTGGAANTIAPGKRPLSSMTPTFLETQDRVAILGTPGGSRIINMLLLATLEFAHGRGGVRDWVALPRFHHQYSPDVIEYEPAAFDSDDIAELERRGHRLKPKPDGFGNMQAVLWDKRNQRVEAASDPRGEGVATVK